jgi:uncharacterized caspase-like protein
MLENWTHSTSSGGVLDETNGRRYALLIGNEKYTNLPPLDNPVNDASDMKEALESVGFNVIHLTNAPDKRTMKEVVRKFARQLKSGDVGLFFYSGHAVQVKGKNYLIPTKVTLYSESEVEYDTLSANYVLSEMDDARNDFNIVILDASCQSNPLKKTRSIGAKGGLGKMGNPGGSMIAFSTAPGAVPLCSKGRNSFYTKRLKEAVKIPGLSISDMFTWVRQKVHEDTNGEQTPWESVSLTGKFCFAGCQDQFAKKREQELLALIKERQATEQRQKRLAAERRERENQERLAAEKRELEHQRRLAAERRERENQERLAAERRERENQERLAEEQKRQERFDNFYIRHALVIGNGVYSFEEPLNNTVNDAKDMAKKLNKLGFKVTRKINVDQRTMDSAITAFGKRLKRGDVGLFYYSGHGAQYNGENFLIPLKAKINSDVDLKYEAVNLGRVLDYMAMAENALNIVILDACRTNPYSERIKGKRKIKGLTDVKGGSGTVIAYATESGNVALDGDGRNSPYTEHLLRFIDKPGLTVFDMFNKVGMSVRVDTDGEQEPWFSSSSIPDFCFAGC